MPALLAGLEIVHGGQDYVAHYAKAFRANFIERVLGGVPIAQLHVIV